MAEGKEKNITPSEARHRMYGAEQDADTERQQEKKGTEADSRGDLYGDDKPYEDQLTKDEDVELPNQQAIDEEKEELKYRRPK